MSQTWATCSQCGGGGTVTSYVGNDTVPVSCPTCQGRGGHFESSGSAGPARSVPGGGSVPLLFAGIVLRWLILLVAAGALWNLVRGTLVTEPLDLGLVPVVLGAAVVLYIGVSVVRGRLVASAGRATVAVYVATVVRDAVILAALVSLVSMGSASAGDLDPAPDAERLQNIAVFAGAVLVHVVLSTRRVRRKVLGRV